jgi:hypothetical protein
MATDISICQSALTRIGAQPLASFADGTAESVVCANNYPDLRLAALVEHPWRFATTTRQLTLLAGTPDPPWNLAYQLPADCLEVQALTPGEPSQAFPSAHRQDRRLGIVYDRMGTKVLTNQPEPVFAKFTWDVPEAGWPPWFVELMILRMAALLASGLTERAPMAQLYDQKAVVQARLARYSDARAQTGRRIPTGRLVASRF